MDQFLSLIGIQAMKYAVRSGIVLTSKYALNQCSQLVTRIDDRKLEKELISVQKLLENKIRVQGSQTVTAVAVFFVFLTWVGYLSCHSAYRIKVTVIIATSTERGLSSYRSGRGNTFLESAVPMTTTLHQQISSLGTEIEAMTNLDSLPCSNTDQNNLGRPSKTPLSKVLRDMKSLLKCIDRDIPLLQLAISASGESLSASLPPTISPSRLLQASTFIVMGDSQFAHCSRKPVQIGPTFSLSLYMLFVAHGSRNVDESSPDGTGTRVYGLGENDRKPIWQEVMHKAEVHIYRSRSGEAMQQRSPGNSDGSNLLPGGNTSPSYHYYLELKEDLDDGRLHCDANIDPALERESCSVGRELIPVNQISKIFYTDTGKLLNIRDPVEGDNRPVLLLKRDCVNSQTKSVPECHTTMVCCGSDVGNDNFDQSQNLGNDLQAPHQGQISTEEGGFPNSTAFSNLPSHLDPEWLALEMYVANDDGGDESGVEEGITVASSISHDQNSNFSDISVSEDVVEYTSKSPLSIQTDIAISDETKESSDVNTLNLPESSELLSNHENSQDTQQEYTTPTPFTGVTTSLSLLEMMIRLVGLQECQQKSHLSIPDHILTVFLEETSTTGCPSTTGKRSRKVMEQRVGFDPFVHHQGS
jgi:hypothetical protein